MMMPSVAQGMAFCNKMWNAFRLVQGWETTDAKQEESNAKSVVWMNARIKAVYAEINDHFSKYRLNDALMCAFKLFTDDFSGWYLEMIKPAYQQPIDKTTYDAADIRQTAAYHTSFHAIHHRRAVAAYR